MRGVAIRSVARVAVQQFDGSSHRFVLVVRSGGESCTCHDRLPACGHAHIIVLPGACRDAFGQQFGGEHVVRPLTGAEKICTLYTE